MRKVICGFLVAVLLLSVTVLISGTAFADQKNVSVSASIAQSDNKFSMSSSDKVKTFRYGKGAIGSFQISGNINEETTYQGVQAVGLESGTIAFKYNYSGAYLKDSDTSWSIIDDFIERAMERIISKNIDREKLKIELASDWDELDKRGIQVIRNIKTILEDEGLPNDQIEWGFNFPSLSIQNAKRLRKLETTIKDIIIEMTIIKCLEEALKKLESN